MAGPLIEGLKAPVPAIEAGRPRVVRPNSGPPGRRIIQIAVAYNSDREIREDSLYALCNDGSVWVMCWGDEQHHDESYWARLADVPTD